MTAFESRSTVPKVLAMAIQKQPHEDLMADATAYVRRMLLRLHGGGNSDFSACRLDGLELFVGTRKDGGWSFYFGEDPVVQLNSQLELRRLVWGSRSFAAHDRRLLELRRNGLGGKVGLQREELRKGEMDELLSGTKGLLQIACKQLETGEATLLRSHPANQEWLDEVCAVLRQISVSLFMAMQPSAV